MLYPPFRDYKNTSDPDTSDSDFDPHDYTQPKKPKVKRPLQAAPDEQKVPRPVKHARGKVIQCSLFIRV